MNFQVEVDAKARAWMQAHPASEPRTIAYDVHRCCGGGKICSVAVRELSQKADTGSFATGTTEDGMRVLIDPRAARRLPARFGITVRGIGRWAHLDLDLTGEQWGDLLYT